MRESMWSSRPSRALQKKVDGDSLDRKYFRSLPFNKRNIIRDNFNKTYTFVINHIDDMNSTLTGLREGLKSGYEPIFASPSKIILNTSTGDVYDHPYLSFAISR
jgi:hypothetical protein